MVLEAAQDLHALAAAAGVVHEHERGRHHVGGEGFLGRGRHLQAALQEHALDEGAVGPVHPYDERIAVGQVAWHGLGVVPAPSTVLLVAHCYGASTTPGGATAFPPPPCRCSPTRG